MTGRIPRYCGGTALLLLVTLWGCAGVMHGKARYTPGDIVDTRQRRVVSWEEFVHRVEEVPVVFIGESHDQPSHHRMQERILKQLVRDRGTVAVAMEMFTYEDQPVLDAWSRGELDENEFLRRVHWEQSWGVPFLLYRGILDTVRKYSLPLIGLNAPSSVVRKVARKGLAGLSPRDRTKVARRIDLDLPSYRAYLREEFRTHPPISGSDFEFFFEAQRTWEETMADTLAKWIQGRSPVPTILVLAGSVHLYKGYGIPESFRRRTGLPYRIVMPVCAPLADKAIRKYAADYVWVTECALPRPRLGVMLDPTALSEGRLIVRKVMPASAAERLGVRPGDLLEEMNGVPLRHPRDVMKAILKVKRGGIHRLRIRRHGVVREFEFRLGKNGADHPLP